MLEIVNCLSDIRLINNSKYMAIEEDNTFPEF